MRDVGAGVPRQRALAGGSAHPRPRRRSRSDAADARASLSGTQLEAGPTRILVVDDEHAVRRFVTDALRASGYEVVGAASGREALTVIFGESRPPTLLLTDIEMPGMTGVELAARVRADHPAIRIVLMTGREASAARVRERAGLVEGVLLKPFGLAELLHAVLDALPASPGDARP